MPKYYIPTHDEFFNGFRYCDKLEDKLVEHTFYNSAVLDIPENRVVKYLDLDDLRNLGFVIKHEAENYTTLYKNVISEKPTYYVIVFREEFGLPFIELSDMYNHPLMAKVHIKNRNELEWLLNRYGIL